MVQEFTNAYGGIPSTSTAANLTTNTQLKTYTDPGGFFTLQYTDDWTVEYKQPVTKFDKPVVIFKYQLNSGVAISVKNSAVSSPQEFRDFYSSLAYSFANGIPGITIIGEGFGIYSIAGYDTYAFLFKDPNLRDPTNPVKGMMLFRRIGYKEMSIAFGAPPESFDQQMPVVQKMIDSIKITG